jgi:hypothetical protein
MGNSGDPIRNALASSIRAMPGARQVTLARIDPDGGSALAVAESVWGKRTSPRRSGDELGAETCRWRLEDDGTWGFVPHPGDTITEPDGTAWVVTEARTGAVGGRFICEAVRRRG